MSRTTQTADWRRDCAHPAPAADTVAVEVSEPDPCPECRSRRIRAVVDRRPTVVCPGCIRFNNTVDRGKLRRLHSPYDAVCWLVDTLFHLQTGAMDLLDDRKYELADAAPEIAALRADLIGLVWTTETAAKVLMDRQGWMRMDEGWNGERVAKKPELIRGFEDWVQEHLGRPTADVPAVVTTSVRE